jgi:hypothetical protein
LGAPRRCRTWLGRLDRGERVVVNLRPETDPETKSVSFDRPRVLRVLARIIADLDELAGYPPILVPSEDGPVRHRPIDPHRDADSRVKGGISRPSSTPFIQGLPAVVPQAQVDQFLLQQFRRRVLQ